MLYLLGGNNLYESTQRLKELKHEFTKVSEGIVQVFNADELDDINRILSSADSLSLFSKKKLTIIKRIFSSGSNFEEKLADYIESVKNVDLILWEDKPFDKRKRLYKLLKKKGVVEEFSKPRYSRLKSWASKYLNGKIEFDPECINTIILKVGDDQQQLASILDNLIILTKSNKKDRLTLEEVDAFVKKTTEENIWEFVDAVGNKDKALALRIIEGLMREKSDFVMVVAMIARQFRIIAQVLYLLGEGKNPGEITKTLKLHPFVVRKAVSQSINFSLPRLQKLYKKLVKTDLVVKQGKFEGKLALDLLITAL